LIVNNLASGLRDGSIYDFVRLLARDGDEVALRHTDGGTDVASMLADARSYDLVVASGGDGTIAAVCYALHDTGIPILPFPAGTGNLLSLNLDEPEEPYALVQLAQALHTQDYDMGELSCTVDSQEVRRGFMIMAGTGFDASIMQRSEKYKDPFGPMAYVAAAITDPLPTVADFELTLDEGKTVATRGIAVLIANFSKIMPDISITHGNNAQDGLFEVIVLRQRSAIELLPALFSAWMDRDGGFAGRTEGIEVFLSSQVSVAGTPAMGVQHDGEMLGVLSPFNARILPGAVRLVVE
jgi:diacylglycerol kinase family enzyme